MAIRRGQWRSRLRGQPEILRHFLAVGKKFHSNSCSVLLAPLSFSVELTRRAESGSERASRVCECEVIEKMSSGSRSPPSLLSPSRPPAGSVRSETVQRPPVRPAHSGCSAPLRPRPTATSTEARGAAAAKAAEAFSAGLISRLQPTRSSECTEGCGRSHLLSGIEIHPG